MNIENDKWYDLNCLPEPIVGAQLILLLEMVNSDGWKIFKRLRDIEARSSACVALNPSSPLEQQQAHRATWHALASDIAFGANLKEAMNGVVGKTKEEIGFADSGIEEAPIPSVEEYDKAISNNADKQ